MYLYTNIYIYTCVCVKRWDLRSGRTSGQVAIERLEKCIDTSVRVCLGNVKGWNKVVPNVTQVPLRSNP